MERSCFATAAAIVVARDVRLRAVPDRRRAVRIDDGAGAEDFLLPRAVVDGDVLGGVRLRHRQRDLPVHRRARPPIASRSPAAELAVLFGLIGLVTGPLWGAQGVGRVVAVGRAADLGAGAVADLRRLPAAAALRRAGLGEARRRRSRSSAWPTCRSSTGRSTSGGRVHPKTTVVPTLRPGMRGPFWCCVLGVPAAVRAAARGARAARDAPRASSTSCILRSRTDHDDATCRIRRRIAAVASLLAPSLLAALVGARGSRRARSSRPTAAQDGFVPVDEPAAAGAAAGGAAGDGRLRGRLGRGVRLRLVDLAAPRRASSARWRRSAGASTPGARR